MYIMCLMEPLSVKTKGVLSWLGSTHLNTIQDTHLPHMSPPMYGSLAGSFAELLAPLV
jgi:hypothetical protein